MKVSRGDVHLFVNFMKAARFCGNHGALSWIPRLRSRLDHHGQPKSHKSCL